MIFEKKILGIYKNLAYTRCDDKGCAYYFSSDDFPGMKKERYPLYSSLGHKLSAYLYSYADAKPGRLVIFEHGFFGGHRSYMREIEMLCRGGYLVLAYDHTGCMESGGETPGGMAQSLADLNDVINALKKDERFSGVDISVVGHSWGGFSTLNIVKYHPNISHIVAISGFVSVEMLVNSFFSGILRGYRKAVMALEHISNPVFVTASAIDTLKNSNVKSLLIYSDNDQMCKKSVHYDALAKSLSEKENVELLLVSGKGHNPNYTHSAVAYLGEYSKILSKLSRRGKLASAEQREKFVKSFDWWKMTEQDKNVWERIFVTLEK